MKSIKKEKYKLNDSPNASPIMLSGKELKIFIVQLAEYIKTLNILRIHENNVYMFDNSIYVPLNENIFCQWIFNEANKKGVILQYRSCVEVMKEAILRSPVFVGIPNSEDYTVFRNCCISNHSGQVSGYPENYFATIRVEANYLTDTQLYHPMTDAFLYTICDGDPNLIKRHWEYWGYCLSSDARAKIIFFLYGPSGNNGKSTELALQKNLLSAGSVDNMPMRTLLSEFGKNRLRHLRLEISADEGEVNLNSRDIGYLKTFSGHDDITANVKFKDFVTFTCTSKIIISSNNNIGMAYSTVDEAFTRRLLTIPYPVSIPKEQQDPYILNRLLAERDAIATEAFRHYLALRERNYVFSDCGVYEMQQSPLFMPVNNEYNAIRVFSDTNCDFSDIDSFTSTLDLYNSFNSMNTGIFKDITGFSQAFYRANADKLEKARKHTNAQNIRGFYGVKLNNKY